MLLPGRQVPPAVRGAQHATGRARSDRPIGMKAGNPTNPLTTARPLARAAAALACVLAAAPGLAAAGCARSPAGAGSPVPAPAIARLTMMGSRAAKTDGDAAPLQMTAVLTTHAEALTLSDTRRLRSRRRRRPGVPGHHAGHFTATAASRPLEQPRRPGATCPSSWTPGPSRYSTPGSAPALRRSRPPASDRSRTSPVTRTNGTVVP